MQRASELCPLRDGCAAVTERQALKRTGSASFFVIDILQSRPTLAATDDVLEEWTDPNSPRPTFMSGLLQLRQITRSRGRGILLILVSPPHLPSPHPFSLDLPLPPNQTHRRDPQNTGVDIRRAHCQAGTRDHDQKDVGTWSVSISVPFDLFGHSRHSNTQSSSICSSRRLFSILATK